jgi:sarcosine oxidase subunit alpha
MPETVTLNINGRPLAVRPGTVVAAALAQAGLARFRGSVSDESRGPLCGVGICFECRVAINGQPHCRSCLVLCEPGMEVRTDD